MINASIHTAELLVIATGQVTGYGEGNGKLNIVAQDYNGGTTFANLLKPFDGTLPAKDSGYDLSVETGLGCAIGLESNHQRTDAPVNVVVVWGNNIEDENTTPEDSRAKEALFILTSKCLTCKAAGGRFCLLKNLAKEVDHDRVFMALNTGIPVDINHSVATVVSE